VTARPSAKLADRFWETKTLRQMSQAEWEALCDGCGKCCLHKLEDEESGVIEFTNVACRLLDLDTCRCSNYRQRKSIVPDCTKLTPDTLDSIDWLPMTCAYRRLNEGKKLPSWHPLLTGDPESVHQAGVSLRGRLVSETEAGPLEHHLLDFTL
jgi:uncharacterized protein